MEPHAVIQHRPEECRLIRAAVAGDSATVLASGVSREGERHLGDSEVSGIVVVSDLNAVVGVDALCPREAQIVLSIAILIGDDFEPLFWHPQNLSTQTGMAVELRVRLPSVDEPRFDLQLVGREPLRTNAVKEPWGIGRHIGGLISPVIEIVITEETDVRHEDPRIDVEPMLNVEVIPAPSFRYILVSVLEVPLTDTARISDSDVSCRTRV